MAKNYKRPMKAKTRDRLVYVVSGVLTAGVLALILFGVKKCNDNADERDMLRKKAIVGALRLDSIKNENNGLIVENDSLCKDLKVANDSIVVLNDSIDVLNTKNNQLKHDKDSIIAELDDCKESKKVVKKTVAPVKKISGPENVPAKPVVKKPMQHVGKPSEPTIIHQDAKNENQGPTTVNVNTPGNTINISNGGIINNFFGDYKAAEQEYKDQYQKDLEEYRNSVYISAKKVRCR